MAIISSNGIGGGDPAVGASWAGGVAPSLTDDAIIVAGDTMTMGQDLSVKSLWINGGTLAGGAGWTVFTTGHDASNYCFDHDGTITGIVNVEVGDSNATTNMLIDILAVAGNIENLTCQNTTYTLSFDAGGVPAMDGNLNIATGVTFKPANVANPITIGGNVVITGTFGVAGWTADLIVGGDWSGAGTYTHGNQLVTFNLTGAQTISGTFTFYDLTCGSTDLQFLAGLDITVEHTLTINSSKVLLLRGDTSATTLSLGTAGASGTIANAGTFRAHATSGTSYSLIEAVNISHPASLEGAGVYDWDYGTTNGSVRWKYLEHKGTDATAKTTGGGGVTIVFGGKNDFHEDFTFATNDTLTQASQHIRIMKDLTIDGTQTNGGDLFLLATGTGFFKGYSGDDLKIFTDSAYSFDGTNTFTGAVTWTGVTGSLLAYDATSILNVTGGVTIPGATLFGEDGANKLGDGVTAGSAWVASISWGWLNNAGTCLLPGGASLTLTSANSNVALINTGTLVHNDGTIVMSGTVLQQIDAGGDDLYRVKNSNTTANVEFITSNVSLDGIWFASGTVTETDTVDVTMTGYTPALGTDAPFTHDELETDGRLVESNAGVFDFGDFELPDDIGPGWWYILTGAEGSETPQGGLITWDLIDSMNLFESFGEFMLDDRDGDLKATYTEYKRVSFRYHDGTEWILRLVQMVFDTDNQGKNSPTLLVKTAGFDNWLRMRKGSMKYDHATVTVKEMLQSLIILYTPIKWVDANIDLSNNVAGISINLQGVPVDELITELLTYSADEEFGVNKDQEFWVRQRATTHDGTNDAPVDFDDNNWDDYDLEEIASEKANRAVVFYGADLDNIAQYDDTTDQTNLQTAIASEQPVVLEKEISMSDIADATLAGQIAENSVKRAEKYKRLTIYTWNCEDCEPGMITEVTITENDDLSGTVAFKFVKLRYKPFKTIVNLIEPATLISARDPFTASVASNAKKSSKLDIQRSDGQFELQGVDWDTDDDFNGVTGPGAWVLGGACQVSGGGINLSAASAVGGDVATSAYVPITDIDYWNFVRRVVALNGGTAITLKVQEETTGTKYTITDDYEFIRSEMDATKRIRFELTLDWDGITGVSPKLSFASINWG